MKLIKVVNGVLVENAYLIGEDKCYIIDPGESAKKIINAVNNNFSGVKAILLTHGHYDHVKCVDELYNTYNCPIYMSINDQEQIDKSYKGNDKLGPYVATLTSPYIDAIKLDDKNIIVIETPGHTEGSVCYLFKKEKILFSGDTLFKSSIGRFDLPGGNHKKLVKSLELLMSLDDSIKVFPGHDESTTIGIEKYENPYLY